MLTAVPSAASLQTRPSRTALSLSRRVLVAAPTLLGVASWARAEEPVSTEPPEFFVRAGPDDEASRCYGSVCAALAAAPPGARVVLDRGYYPERVVVTQAVILQAAPGAEVILEHTTELPYEATLQVECEGVTLRGLTVRHSSPSIAANYALLVRAGGSAQLDRCLLSSATGSGLGCEGGKVLAEKCSFSSCARHGAFFSGDLDGESPLGQSVLDSCLMEGNRGDGALLRDGALVTLRACRLEGNAGVGLRAADAAVSLVGCTLRGNKKGSLEARRMVRLDVEGLATDATPVMVS